MPTCFSLSLQASVYKLPEELENSKIHLTNNILNFDENRTRRNSRKGRIPRREGDY
jgi:hypothetical protein